MPSVAPPTALRRGHVRRVLGVLWLLDAALQCQPGFFHADAWTQDVAQSVMGEPPWVSRGVYAAIHLVAAHPALSDGVFVVVQAALGLALLTDRLVRTAILASVPYAVGVWWVGEGFGALPTGFGQLFAGAPGPAVLYPVLALLAWPRPAMERPGGARRTPAGDGPVAAAAPWVWAALWAGQALLLVPWVYPPAQVLRANLEENALNAPGWLLPAIHWVGAAATRWPVAAMVALGALQLGVGLGVLVPRLRRPALGVGLVATAAFWVIGQAVAGVLVAGGTDPGTAPLVALLGLALWPRPHRRTAGVIRGRHGSVLMVMPDATPHERTDRPQARRPRRARGARRLVTVGVVAAAATGLAACGGGATGTAAPGAPAASSAAAGGTPAANASVTIKNFAFSPAALTVRPGATITVTNRDGVAHTFTARDGAFDTGDIQPGRTATVTAPSKPGSYPYYCTIHQFMTGTLTVSGG